MDDKIIRDFFEERTGFTNNPQEAIYILRDGTLVSGGYEDGVRGEDHAIAEGLIDGDRYDDSFWSELHFETEFVRLAPETKTALIMEKQKLNPIQENVIKEGGYVVEEYCPPYKEKALPLDLDQFLAKRGLSSPVSDYLTDKMKGNRQLKTQQGTDKFHKEAEAAREEYHKNRNDAINEYKNLVQEGKIRPKTSFEKTMTNAHGHSDLDSTHAARRMLAKKGISWKTGEPISKEFQDMSRDLYVELEIGEIVCDQLGEQLNELNEKISDYFKEIEEAPVVSVSVHTPTGVQLERHLIEPNSLLAQYKSGSINVLNAIKESINNEQIILMLDELEQQLIVDSAIDINSISPAISI